MIQFRGATLGPAGAPILTDVNADFPTGHLCAVIGPSGSGKSELLLAAIGVRRLSAGVVTVNGINPSDAPLLVRSRVCLVAPMAPLPGHRSVLGCARFLSWLGIGVRPTTREAVEALRFAEIPDRLMRKPAWTVGLYERFCVWLAVFRLRKGSILICDDPLAGVSARQSRAAARQMRDIVSAGGSVIVTSREDWWADHADQVFRFESGSIAVQGKQRLEADLLTS